MDEHSNLDPAPPGEPDFPPSWAVDYPGMDPVLVQEALSSRYGDSLRIIKLDNGQFACFDQDNKLSAIGTWDDLRVHAETFVPKPYTYTAPSSKKTVKRPTLTLADLGLS